jgi:hypothetical protein
MRFRFQKLGMEDGKAFPSVVRDKCRVPLPVICLVFEGKFRLAMEMGKRIMDMLKLNRGINIGIRQMYIRNAILFEVQSSTSNDGAILISLMDDDIMIRIGLAVIDGFMFYLANLRRFDT